MLDLALAFNATHRTQCTFTVTSIFVDIHRFQLKDFSLTSFFGFENLSKNITTTNKNGI